MKEMSELNSHLTTCSFASVWFIWVELADRDDARVREAVVEAIGRRVPIRSTAGSTSSYTMAGEVVIEIDGAEYRLVVLDDAARVVGILHLHDLWGVDLF